MEDTKKRTLSSLRFDCAACLLYLKHALTTKPIVHPSGCVGPVFSIVAPCHSNRNREKQANFVTFVINALTSMQIITNRVHHVVLIGITYRLQKGK